MTGKVPGIVEGGDAMPATFTGATGVFLFDGDQWGDLGQDIAIVADVGGNLVHRKKLTEKGIQWSGERMDEGTEFLRSSDLWFRPVQFSDGSDGCLYVIDMCREVIEHPASLPPIMKKQLDLTAGRDKGRIWRVKKKGTTDSKALVPLDQMSTKELAALVEHPNGWHRETAARLLYERQDASAIEPLRSVARPVRVPKGGCKPWQALQDFLKGSMLRRSRKPSTMSSSCCRICYSESSSPLAGWSQNPNLKQSLRKRWKDPSLHVRMAIASLGLDGVDAKDQVSWITSLGDGFWTSQELRTVVEATTISFAPQLLKDWISTQSLSDQEKPWMRSILYQAVQKHGVETILPHLPKGKGEPSVPSKMLVSAFSEILTKHPNLVKTKELELLRPWIETSILPNVQSWWQPRPFPRMVMSLPASLF